MFMLYAILAGLVLGFALGGRPGTLGQLQFRWIPLALAALLCQLVLFWGPVAAAVGRLGPPLYVGSTLLVLVVVLRNIPVAPGLGLVAAGAASNLAAITANGGYMPATAGAMAAAGRALAAGYSNSSDPVHPVLAPLVDRYAIPAGVPLANVFSVGDVLIGLGVAAVIAVGMRHGRATARASSTDVRQAPPADAPARTAPTPRMRRRAERIRGLGGSVAPRLWTVASPRTRVLAFSLLLAVLGVTEYLLVAPGLPSPGGPLSIPWPLLAVAYCAAEIYVIDVPFRRETHSFSLSEIPMVLGLFFVEPRTYILAMLLGAAAALLASREPSSKILFNLSYFLVSSVTSLWLFHLFASQLQPFSLVDCPAAFIATLSASWIGAVAIAAVITLSGAAPQFQRLPQMLQVGAFFAVTNTSIALLAVDILWNDPLSVWLVAVPVITIFLAYRSYLSERRKHESLELLYESSRIFQRSPELDSAVVALLEHARVMFRSDRAEIVVQDVRERVPRRTSVGPGAASEVMVAAPDRTGMIARLRADPTSFMYVPGQDVPMGGDRLFRHAMVSPLHGESGLMGAFLVADRTDVSDEFRPEELRLLETVANQAAVALENGQLERALSELSRLKEELHHQAFHDPLTGLANRALFMSAVSERLGASDEHHVPVVLFLDLDDFKVVNDTVGHSVGDLILQAVAERIQGCIRADDVAARLGGDEFAVLITDDPALPGSTRVAERIGDALRRPFTFAAREFHVHASIGLALGEPGQRVEEILRDADVAMYDAKRRGKGRVAVWNPALHAAIIDRHELGTDLSGAVGRDELTVSYQPLIALASGQVVGFEALARWNHPVRGPVPPEDFIALAEENGAIISLGRNVLQRACEQASQWERQPGLVPLSVSVNISPHQVGREGFVDEVRAILASTQLAPNRLVLEMTETALFRDLDGAITTLQALRRVGVRLAIDDFGTGYSSLRYLQDFPVDELKIAKEFVRDDAQEDWAIARAVVALGRALELTVVAEGIEHAFQRDRLRQLGCQVGQGYFFSRPLTPEQIRGFLGGARSGGDQEWQAARTLPDRTNPAVAQGWSADAWTSHQ